MTRGTRLLCTVLSLVSAAALILSCTALPDPELRPIAALALLAALVVQFHIRPKGTRP